TRRHQLRHPLRLRPATAGDEQIAGVLARRDRGRDEAGADGDAVLAAPEVGLVSVRARRAGRPFRALNALLALQALWALGALHTLRASGAARAGIALGSAFAGRPDRADARGPCRSQRTGRPLRPRRSRRPGETGGAAFREQLGGDRLRVDRTALFDRGKFL